MFTPLFCIISNDGVSRRHQLLDGTLGRGQRQECGSSHGGLLAAIPDTQPGEGRSMRQRPNHCKPARTAAMCRRRDRSENAEEP